jgi:hypothetical protein
LYDILAFSFHLQVDFTADAEELLEEGGVARVGFELSEDNVPDERHETNETRENL